MTKLKIKNRSCAASAGLFHAKDNTIELLDTSYLKNAHSNYSNLLPEERSLRKNIDQDTYFFYTLEYFTVKNRKKSIVAFEKGVGTIIKEGKKYFLQREMFFEHKGIAPTDKNGYFIFKDGTYLVIGSYAPENHNEVYAIPHSVAYTDDQPFSPQILQLDDNSLLGRLDGDIQSIDQEELKRILGYEDPILTLKNYDGPLVLNSKFIELVGKKSMILSDQVALKPQKIRPREKQAGSIIFNEKKNRFEGFDGKKWRPLQWGDE